MQNTRIPQILIILSTISLSATPCLAEKKHRKFPGISPQNTPASAETPSTAAAGVTELSNTPHPKARGGVSSVIDNRPSSSQSGLVNGRACAHSIESFIQIASASSPQSSPKGLYFISDMRETPQVFFLSKPGAWPEQVSFFPDGVSYYRVSPSGDKLLLATNQGGNEQYQIHLLDETGKITPLLTDPKTRVESIAWSQNSKWFAYTANSRNGIDFDLYRFELDTKKNEKLVDLSGNNTVSDIFGDSIAVTTFRSVVDADVFIFDAKERKSIPVTQSGGDSYNQGGYFTADGKSLLFLSDREKGIHQIFSQAPGKPAKLITSEAAPVEDITISNKRNQITYLVNDNGYSTLIWLDIDGQGGKKRIHTFPKNEKSVIRSTSFGKSGFFYSESSSTRTGDIWFWNGQTKTKWTKSAELKTECFQSEELVSYPSFDGLKVPAFLYRARSGEANAPYIVYIHGGPESQFRPSFTRIFQYFLQRGFGVFAPNIRGSTGFGRKYTQLDNYKKRMDSIEDIVAGAKWLVDQGLTTPKKLMINGGSYGGFAVLRTIQVAPDLFAAASESVGISNFVTFLKNTKPYRRALREVEYGPLSDEEFLKSISPTEYLDKIKTPLIIFHGANDPRVPVSETEQIVKELKGRDVEVDFKIFADEGHGNKKLGNQMEQARLMAHFFDKQLNKEEKK